MEALGNNEGKLNPPWSTVLDAASGQTKTWSHFCPLSEVPPSAGISLGRLRRDAKRVPPSYRHHTEVWNWELAGGRRLLVVENPGHVDRHAPNTPSQG